MKATVDLELFLSVNFVKLFTTLFLKKATMDAMNTYVDFKAQIGWEIDIGVFDWRPERRKEW
ncbi:MAG: hypothetical protein EA399_16165 [Desulfovibrionales bacterium]|nr:MAG: hypothetical protein EA399_16165 [Desulfovibrionales bacterium]